LLGKSHRLFSDILRPFAGGLGVTFEFIERAVGGGNEPVKGVLRLLDTLFRKCPHLRGNIEAIGGGHSRLLL
jgi:hypothetical protein